MKNRVIRHHFPEIDSTNNWCKKEIGSFDPDAITIVTADRQTNGRGRFGKSWYSPAGNLYVTFCFFWDKEKILNIPQLMSLVLVDLLKNFGIEAKIKWPNDVLVENKKIAGILCETVFHKDKKAIILGVGVNLDLSEEETRFIDQPASSLKIEGIAHLINPQNILEKLVGLFVPELIELYKTNKLFFLNRYRENITYQKGDPFKDGSFEDIDNEGFLIIKNSQNKRVRISAC